jgi:RimJ/RimL family protein N-acetyltransferase
MTEKKKTPKTTIPELVGDKVYLKPAKGDDIAATWHWFLLSDPLKQGLEPQSVITAAEAAEAFVRRDKSPAAETFVAVRSKDDTPIAIIAYKDLNSLNRTAELEITVDPDERRKGLGSDAVKLLGRYLFLYRSMNRLYASISALNEPARAMLEKLGFRRDGVLRQHHFYNGEYHDVYVYSMLRFECSW